MQSGRFNPDSNFVVIGPVQNIGLDAIMAMPPKEKTLTNCNEPSQNLTLSDEPIQFARVETGLVIIFPR